MADNEGRTTKDIAQDLLDTSSREENTRTRLHLPATRCVGYDPSAMRTRQLGDTRKTRKDKYEGTGG